MLSEDYIVLHPEGGGCGIWVLGSKTNGWGVGGGGGGGGAAAAENWIQKD